MRTLFGFLFSLFLLLSLFQASAAGQQPEEEEEDSLKILLDDKHLDVHEREVAANAKPLNSMPGPKPSLVEELFFHGHQDPNFIRFKSLKPYQKYADQYGDLVHYKLSKGGEFVLVSGAEELKTIYESETYWARPFTPYIGYTYGRVVGRKDESLFDGIAISWGDDWRRLRPLVDEVFQERIPFQFGDFNGIARELVHSIRETGLNNPSYVPHDEVYKATIRLVGRQTYGSFFTEEVAKQFDVAVNAWLHYFGNFLVFDYKIGTGWPLVAEIFKIPLDKQMDVIGEFSRKVLDHKRATGNYGNDWMGLFASKKGADGKPLTDEEVIALCFDLVLGSGPDTTTLEYGFYLLGTNKDQQIRLRESLKEWKSTGKDLTMEDLAKNTVLHNMFKEVIRSYPTGGGINGRLTMDRDYLGGYLIPKGTATMINSVRVQQDPRYWTHPERFDPDRFLRNEPSHPYAYSPFGSGNRRCPGYQHASAYLMVAMAHLYKEFDVTYQEKEAPEMIFNMFARPLKYYPILFKNAPK